MKKKENIIKNNGSTESGEYINLLIIIGIITIVFVLFYALTVIFTKKNHDDIFKNDLEVSEIQYNEIIIGNMFKNDGDYYVLMTENNDELKDTFISIASAIKAKKKIYTIDLSNAFNKKYIKDSNSYEKDNFSTKGTMLIKISDHKIKEHYTTKEEILAKLLELSK